MTEGEAGKIASHGYFDGKPIGGEIIETHISWVIVADQYVFKIKKPVRLPFLDFSTRELRRKACRREVALNRRSTNIYLRVLPVRKARGKFVIGRGAGRIVDYIVQMKRVHESFRMDHLLKRNAVSHKMISTLAKAIARFHRKAVPIKSRFNAADARSLFHDISRYNAIAGRRLGSSYAASMRAAVAWSNGFIDAHEADFKARIARGFVRDVHGDLHSRNIFLRPVPVIFDCIEFNDSFRRIDVLYEIAFLVMDLEAEGKTTLATQLLSDYLKAFPCMPLRADTQLLNYFKCLRAAVRAKVHLISLQQHPDRAATKSHVREAKKYLDLMSHYVAK